MTVPTDPHQDQPAEDTNPPADDTQTAPVVDTPDDNPEEDEGVVVDDQGRHFTEVPWPGY